MEPQEGSALAVDEEHNMPLAYTTTWSLEKASACGQCGQWQICARCALQYLVQTGSFREREGKLALPRDHFPLDLPPPLPIFFHAAQSLPSKRKSMSYRGEGPVWIYCDCSCCFGEGANGDLKKRRWESSVLTLPGTSFQAPSGRVFLGNTETFLTALAVHMRVVGRVSLLQDGDIWNLTSCGKANDKEKKKRKRRQGAKQFCCTESSLGSEGQRLEREQLC